MQIGRRIYYDLATGNVIVDTGERSGSVVETTIEQDFTAYTKLAERVPETVGMLQLDYGLYAQDFAESNGYQVNVSGDEPVLEFSYPTDPEDPPVYRLPLSVEVAQLQLESVDTMLALTEVYETNAVQDAQREQEGVDTMLALTEAYEMLLSQQETIATLTARIEALETGGGN